MIHLVDNRGSWSSVLDDVSPGDEIHLAPGRYIASVAFTRGGRLEEPVVLRSMDQMRPATLVPGPAGSPILDLRANDVVIDGLAFGPSGRGIHALVLRGASRVTVKRCRFHDIGGLAIVETMTARDIVIRANRIVESRTTALYFGCHGGECAITDLLIESNHIEHVSAPSGSIGYGIQVKLNSRAIVRNNTIIDTKGPGVMIYGCEHDTPPSIVERNRVMASRRSSGIVIGGGPVIVRGNIVVNNRQAGIRLEDYGRRGLLRAIEVRDNVTADNRWGGISIGAAGRGVRIAHNQALDAARAAGKQG
ncbi:MAG TPA: right-handed parallel beta-helix repeat-containing protein [Gaiellales bacterium]|nr:right-handed parallel beta-helix repeat-containing protein [Gaiellales bacterium]